MIASQSLTKEETMNLSLDSAQSPVDTPKHKVSNTPGMGEVNGLEDKNGNLEIVKESVPSDLPDKVCRTCLSIVEPESCVVVNSLDSDDKLGNIIATCLPQINLQLTNDPIICQKCFTKLEDYYNFFISCSNTEAKLVTYCSSNNVSPPIKLCDVLKHKLNDSSEALSVKLEDDDNENDVDPIDNDDMDDMDLDVKSEDEEEIKETSKANSKVRKRIVKEKKLVKRRKRIRKKVPKPTTEDGKTLFSADLAEASVKCEICNKKFPNKWALDRHTPKHTTDHKFVCETCTMGFRYKHSFEKHLLAHINGAPVNKPFACECGKFFNRRAKLRKHELTHVKKVKPFGCEECGKRFVNEEKLSSHVFRVHASEKPFSCELCGNKYTAKSGLDNHFKTHFPSDKPKPEPDLMCDFCGKLFFRKYALEKHRMSHTGNKPHKCDQCGMAFKERYQLTIHTRRHTGEKPFDCEICGYKFTCGNQLRVHMRTHTGERPFPCQMCDMAFTRKDHLIKHVRAIHTGERPFECDICLKTFNRRDYLMKHKKVHVKRGL